MIWRSAIVAAYVALAVVVGVAYGLTGLATLLFFYFCAAVWTTFLLNWGALARAAGRWHVRRLETPRPEDATGLPRPPDGDLQPTPDAVAMRPETLTALHRRRRPAPAL